MYATILNVTPEMAERFLAKNTHNRRVNQQLVDKYAADMKMGRWEVNGESICIAEDGTLKDGQHRLRAVIKANTEVRMLVVFDVGNDVHEYDRGMARTAAHVLQLNGYSKTAANNTGIGAINVLLGGKRSTDAEIMRVFDELGNIPEEALRIVQAGTNKAICYKSACAAAAITALYYGVDAAMLRSFFEIANTGFSSSKCQSAAIVLRNYIVSNKRYSGGAFSKELYSVALQSIVDYRDGIPRRRNYDAAKLPPMADAMKETVKSWIS